MAMLRLNTTQITLNKKDLEQWHIPRHEQRQAQRASFRSSAATNKTTRCSGKQAISPIRKMPYPTTHHLATMPTRTNPESDTEIVTNEPVPLTSRAYWDRVLAEAGSPTRTRTAALASPTVILPSDDFLDSTHSSRASIEEASTGLDNCIEDDIDNQVGDSSSPEVETPFSSDSSNSTRHKKVSTLKPEQRPPSGEVVQPASSRRRLSFFSFRRKTQQHLDGSSANGEHYYADRSLSGSMAVDGASDRRTSYKRESSESSGVGLGSNLNDGLYGSRRDRRTISQAFSNGDDDTHCQDHDHSRTRIPDRTVLPPPRAIAHSRNCSGVLPRSSLYISEAAASSSPERRPRTPPDHNPSTFERQGLLSQPPRRRKMYRPRSQTYSFAESEHSHDPAVPQLDGPSAIQALPAVLPSLHVPQLSNYIGDSPRDLPILTRNPFLTPPTPAFDDYLPSSPPEIPAHYSQGVNASPSSNYSVESPHDAIEIKSYLSLSSIHSVQSRVPSSQSRIYSSPSINNDYQPALPRRNLSPYSASIIPGNAHRNLSSQLNLPPPFSSTSRNVSLSYTYPPSSPASPHIPPPHQPLNSMSPVVRPPTRIPIYNDNLSPSLQPQTPAGLPRHGVPPTATQNSFNTAPARVSGLTRTRAVADWQAFATPTRRPEVRARNNRAPEFGTPELDVENAGALREEDRRERRERMADPGRRAWQTEEAREWNRMQDEMRVMENELRRSRL